VIRIIRALMTKRNKPRVTKVMGKVRMSIIGLIKILTIPRTRATIAAPINPLTVIP